MKKTLVFDIETIPDTDSGRLLHGLADVSDKDVATAMEHLQNQKTGSEFLPHYLHRIVAISVVLAEEDKVKVWSLGEVGSDEKELIGRFFDGIERLSPELVSWNGSGFDLPVLNCRALLHSVAAPRYWETGDEDSSFRYNNYLGRFHWRHIDLMDVLSGYQLRAAAPLDKMAQMLGFPGKQGMAGADVWQAWQEGRVEEIRNYCETDALNTYLIYLRFQLMRGHLSVSEHEHACTQLKEALTASEAKHLKQFVEAWGEGAGSVKP